MDPVAAGGFAAASATYSRIRPAYARRAIGVIKECCPRDGHVVDVAAGTGILTGQLARAGLKVTAVEPLAPMAHHLRLALPAVPAVRAMAEALPFETSTADVLTVGQAFHWFSSDAALDEAARVLRPGGVLALLWNVRDESVPWVRELTELVEARTGGRPYTDHRERDWVDVVADSGRFRDVRTERFANPVATTVEGVVDRVRSTSFVAVLDPPERHALLAEVAALIARHDQLRGTFEYPHDTVVHLCRTLGSQ
ncbi:MAG: methyltransferase domain-containing protein [Actinomycetota bacterium]|nr:methyltransferase domain-containing protein [Actinomycetota bacterium]